MKKFVSVKSQFDLKGKTAVVTGGAGWLGRSLCESLAEMGANVCVASRDEKKQAKLFSEIEDVLPKANVMGYRLDITNRKSVDSCFAKIIEEKGRIDILVNNAYSGKSSNIEETTDSEWMETFDAGLAGYLRCTQAAVKYMKESQAGTIINIASMYGMVAPYPEVYEDNNFLNPPAYGAAKAAVIQLTKYSAVHLAKYNIRVNCISPGPFPSETVQADKIFIDRLSAKTPLNRIGKPHELKGAVALLASEASSFMTGQNIVVDGGWTVW